MHVKKKSMVRPANQINNPYASGFQGATQGPSQCLPILIWNLSSDGSDWRTIGLKWRPQNNVRFYAKGVKQLGWRVLIKHSKAWGSIHCLHTKTCGRVMLNNGSQGSNLQTQWQDSSALWDVCFMIHVGRDASQTSLQQLWEHLSSEMVQPPHPHHESSSHPAGTYELSSPAVEATLTVLCCRCLVLKMGHLTLMNGGNGLLNLRN